MVFAILIFLATQFSFFIGRPDYKDLGLKLTEESLNTLKLEYIPPEILKNLSPIIDQLFTEEDNMQAISCYKKVGFHIDGLMRDINKTNYGYLGTCIFSILCDEWQMKKKNV